MSPRRPLERRAFIRTGQRLLDLFLPPACAGCGTGLPGGSLGPRICSVCRMRLRSVPHPRCGRCHAPRGTGLPEERACPECADWPRGLAWARSAFVLQEPASTLVHALKYGGWPELADEMAELLHRNAPVPRGTAPQAPLVPIPTTPSRERERGYNQAGVLAAALAERSGRPVVNALVRRDGGGTQVSLHPAERRDNVLEAFSLADGADRALEGREVVLVDDVLTTGATCSAAAEVLERADVARVGVLTFARALPGAEDGTDPAGHSGVPPVGPGDRPGGER